MTTHAVFARTPEQQLEALRRANRVRVERSQLKRRLVALSTREEVNSLLARTIGAPPDWAETMKLRDLLLAAPKYGRVKTDRFLAMARCSAVKTLGSLTERQRREIIDLLEADAAR